MQISIRQVNAMYILDTICYTHKNVTKLKMKLLK